MTEVFIRHYSEEEAITYYMHYVDDCAVRQIEISAQRKVLLSEELREAGDSFLSDQPLSVGDLNAAQHISREAFERVWFDR